MWFELDFQLYRTLRRWPANNCQASSHNESIQMSSDVTGPARSVGDLSRHRRSMFVSSVTPKRVDAANQVAARCLGRDSCRWNCRFHGGNGGTARCWPRSICWRRTRTRRSSGWTCQARDRVLHQSRIGKLSRTFNSIILM